MARDDTARDETTQDGATRRSALDAARDRPSVARSHDGGGWTRIAACVAHDASPHDMRNLRRHLGWMLAWAALAVVDADWFGAEEGSTSTTTVALTIALIVVLIGVINAYSRYVRETDELNRSIQLRALSVGFGAGFVTALVGESVERSGLVDQVGVDVPVVAMLATYAITSVVITRSYR